jgi:hypothetical protein
MSYALSKPSPLEGVRAEGAPVVAIDPDVDNVRARRAYEKAGFRGDAIVETGEGFTAICGQVPVHMGSMVCIDYQARHAASGACHAD